MKLKYERRWEIVEKIIERDENILNGLNLNWETKKSIIQEIFDIRNNVNIFEFWEVFDNIINVLNFTDWEYQQKPLLDKMIEIILWDKE